MPRDSRHSKYYQQNQCDILRRKQKRYDTKPLTENINKLNQQQHKQRLQLHRVMNERNMVETAYIENDRNPMCDVDNGDSYDYNDDIPKKQRRFDAENVLELLNFGHQTGTAKSVPAVISAVISYQRQNGISTAGTPIPSASPPKELMSVMPKLFVTYQSAVMLHDEELNRNLCNVRDGGSYKGRLVTSTSACCKDPERKNGMRYQTLGMPQVCELWWFNTLCIPPPSPTVPGHFSTFRDRALCETTSFRPFPPNLLYINSVLLQ